MISMLKHVFLEQLALLQRSAPFKNSNISEFGSERFPVIQPSLDPQKEQFNFPKRKKVLNFLAPFLVQQLEDLNLVFHFFAF